MRLIKTITDAANALRDLESKFLGSFDITASVMDLKKRRLTNLAPSKDRNDAVIRAELLQITSAPPQPAVSNSDLIGRCVFGLGINSDIVVQDDAVPWHVVAFPLVGGDGKSAKIVSAYWVLKQPPVGASLKVDIFKNPSTPDATKLFSIESAENDDTVQTVGTVDITSLTHLDTLTVNITQVGTTIAGMNMYIVIRYVWQ